MAGRLADRSSEAFRWAKRLLTDSFEASFEEQAELERRGIAECGGHPDGIEGVAAFLAKRRPNYRGLDAC
jgi:2-(1,2-epoxy-1,2-dihydrophenyl)acetyl-CoA isomerase